jgi:K+-sensing histidine kinase KdpD
VESSPTNGPAGAAIGALVGILAALALVPLRDVIDNANIALALVLGVVLCGYFGGRWAGAGAALGTALSFDFFHTQPYLHLRIDTADDIVTTALLLTIGLVVGQLAARSQKRQRQAHRGHSEVERVWRVAELAARDVHPDDVTSAVRAELLSLLHLTDCTFERGPETGLPVMQPEGLVPHTMLVYHEGGFELPPGGFALRVHVGGRTFGHLICRPTPRTSVTTDEKHVAIVLADQLALAIASRARPTTTT